MKLGSGPFYPPRANIAMMKYSAFGTKLRTLGTVIILMVFSASIFLEARGTSYPGDQSVGGFAYLAFVLMLLSGWEKCRKNPELIGYEP